MGQIKEKRMVASRPGLVIFMPVVTALLITGPKTRAAAGPDKISFDKTTVSVKEGITEKITVKNKPAGAKVSWSSKNTKIAKVKKGIITGMKQGKTAVNCKVVYQKGKKKVTKKLTAAVTVGKNKAVYPEHRPYGKGIGAKPGRVVWSHNPESVNWNGEGYWWEPEHFDEKVIAKMFRSSIASLGGTPEVKTG